MAPGGVGRYENLLAYRVAVELADDLRRGIGAWPRIDQWTVGVQLVKAADSVGANVAEAFGRGSPRDEQRFLLFARGSAEEMRHWIERAHARSLITDDAYRAQAARVGQLINGLLRAHRRQVRTATRD